MMKNTLLSIALLLLIAGCEQHKVNTESGSAVEFYLLDSYSTLENSSRIIESGATLNDSALIAYDEIITYNSNSHEFRVAGEVIERLTFASAFAVTVDREIIYTGYIWAAYSSAIVDWIIIDQVFIKDNLLQVQLGYPGTLPGITIPDRRNDPRILEVLRRDKKLIE